MTTGRIVARLPRAPDRLWHRVILEEAQEIARGLHLVRRGVTVCGIQVGGRSPERLSSLDALPKTRSGKIMRRLLKAHELGLPEGDPSTLEED